MAGRKKERKNRKIDGEKERKKEKSTSSEERLLSGTKTFQSALIAVQISITT